MKSLPCGIPSARQLLSQLSFSTRKESQWNRTFGDMNHLVKGYSPLLVIKITFNNYELPIFCPLDVKKKFQHNAQYW